MMKPANPVINRSHPLSRGLVGAWPFFEGGGSAIHDICSGIVDTYNGELHDWSQGEFISSLAKPFGQTLHLDGTSAADYVSCQVAGRQWGSYGQATIAVWVRSDGNAGGLGSTSDTLFMYYGGSNDYLVFNRTYGWVKDGGTHYTGAAFTTNIGDGNWHHAVMVLTGTQVLVYCDGILEGSDAFTGAGFSAFGNPSVILLGERYYNGITRNNELDGEFGDVRVWGRALSSREILDCYQDPWALYRPARPVRELYRGKAAGGGAISTGLSAIEAGAVYGAPGLNSGLHAISTGIAT